MAEALPKTRIRIAPDAVSPALAPYLLSRARFRLFWGGRDGTKSDFDALDLLLQALSLPYFKCILIRKVFNTIGESQMATLRKVAEREGLLPFFEFRVAPLGIRCLRNGNSFICRGLDDPARLKSVSDPTHAWYEEANQITEEEANYVSTSLRSSHTGAVIQEIYSFNPDHEGDYKTFWLWLKFFEGTGNGSALTFSGHLTTEVNGAAIRQAYEVVHTTYADNPWCPAERAATYEAYRLTNPYLHRVWALGLWATKETGNEFYPQFNRATHTAPVSYLPGLPIWQSWDANSLPYCAMFCAQADDQRRAPNGKLTLRIFQEYAIGSPNSGLRNTGRKFLKDRIANGWMDSAVFLTGDASLRARKTGDERSTNFDDVQAALNGYTTDDGVRVVGCLNQASANFWPRRNPEVMRRRDFINYLLAGGYPDITVLINSNTAPLLVADLELVQLGIDGKLKEMYNDKALGVRYQKNAHMADCFDYICCTLFHQQYEQFKAGRGG